MKIHRTIVFLLVLTWLLPACVSPLPQAITHQITVLYTNDEHGWMAGVEPGQGAANLLGTWREQEDYGQNTSVIILSGGDNWTGPAISTWFDGQSMVEVMNAMGYAASTIGNHEFDFGLDAMRARLTEADFPYLSANIRYKDNHATPTDLGVKPFTILEIDGLHVGVVGLTTTSTPYTTNPVNIAAFDFIDYEEALREIIPEVRAAGADLLLVSGHICTSELTGLAKQVQDLGISLLGGGHCHEQLSDKVGDTVIISGGSNLTGYAYAHFTYDPATETIVVLDYGTRENVNGPEDEEVAEIVARWQDESDAELNIEIGYLDKEIPRRSQAMQDLITETWLRGYPTADIAITNLGGMRDRIPSGPVKLAHIISVLPFNNVLVEVKLSGEELMQVLDVESSLPALGGMHQRSGDWFLDDTGEPLDMQETYSVLVNDFMYAGGDNYGLLAQFDPEAYNTAIDWRQPIIDWIIAQASSQENPLDQAIAELAD